MRTAVRLAAAVAAALMVAGCGWPAGAAPMFPGTAGALTVAAAENFYGDLLRQLGGSRVSVFAFLSDPNADPHEYESSAGDARVVADSRLVIENGEGYDAFMERLLEASPRPDRVVIDVQRLVGAPDGANPHLWYDPAAMPRVAAAAAAALERLDPGGAGTYAASLRAVEAALAEITDRVAGLRSRYAGTPVAFTEPVYAYMAAAIGLDDRSPAGFTKAIEEGNEPPASAVAQERDLLTRHRVRVLLYNRQAVTRVTSQIQDLARKSGIPVVGISEMQPPGTTFQAWQLAELAQLEAALAGGR